MSMPKKRRRYNTRRIKKKRLYTVDDIARLFSVHKSTVRHWLRGGLHPIDNNTRPLYIHGGMLSDFLRNKQASAKKTCAPHECYCLKCRAPRTPRNNTLSVIAVAGVTIRLTGICDTCGTALNRFGSRGLLPVYAKHFTLSEERENTPM